MLSYQHKFHAGSAADVHKHVALSLLLAHLAQKEKPFTVIDLYAGEGDYGLGTPEAQKTRDFDSGIARLWARTDIPAQLQRYMDIVRGLNPDGTLVRYPGSPAIARDYLREGDQLILNELHTTSFPVLKRWARLDERIAVHQREGLEALIALTPPKIRRGLALIDPSYEVKTEYADVPQEVGAALHRWAEGIFVVWYPLLADERHKALTSAFTHCDAPTLACELTFAPTKDKASGLRGTGLIVVNPPWQFDVAMKETGAWLGTVLGGRHSLAWLKAPKVS